MRFEDIVIQQFAEFERRLIALERRMDLVAPEQPERSPIQTPPEPNIPATDWRGRSSCAGTNPAPDGRYNQPIGDSAATGRIAPPPLSLVSVAP